MRVAVIANPAPEVWAMLGQTPPEYGVATTFDVVYGRAGEHDLRLDLYQPRGAVGLRPGLVFVHGGGWSAGERQGFRWHAEQAARLGYVAVTIDYRLCGQAVWPAQLDDCQRAVRWLRAQAADLRLDPARLGSFGSSAGGHLAACLGVRDTRDDSDLALAGLPSRVQCVIDYNGIHDLRGPVAASDEARDMVTAFLGAPTEQIPTVSADASPVTFVDDRAAAMLLIHDPGDEVVHYEQSVQLALALMQAGRPVEMLPAPGAGHGFAYSPDNPWQQRTWPVALAWLARHLRP